jgi:RNA polymerase sigma-70 factor (ECF subfamily)
LDEAALTAAAADGDQQACAWLVDRWTAPVYRFARRMLANDQDAYDAAQDTMVKVLRNLHRYDRNRSFSAWLFGIARNTCIDEHRRRKRRAYEPPADVVDPGPTPLQRATSRQQDARLHQAVSQLPTLYREILVLYHFEHLKYGEIAQTLDIPLGTVMNRIFRARKKLRALYDAQESNA